jgi:hypothetical protein
MLRASTQANADPESPVKIAMVNNAITEGEFELTVEVPIEMTAAEKLIITTSVEHIWKGTPCYRNIKTKPSLSSLGNVPNFF